MKPKKIGRYEWLIGAVKDQFGREYKQRATNRVLASMPYEIDEIRRKLGWKAENRG